MISIEEHDRNYKRRISILLPIVLFAHLILFVSFEHIENVQERIFFGYEGPEESRPEVSILHDRTPEEKVAVRRNALAVMDVFIEGVDRAKPESGRIPAARRADEKRPSMEALELSTDEQFRIYPSHAPVPYRRDYVILRMVKPIYPPDALANAQEGYVLIEAYVSKDGTVSEVYVRTASGPRSFEESSQSAVKQFLFKPIHENGKAIPFWASFLVRFEIRP